MTGCIEWPYGRRNGYGRIWFNKKDWGVHRFVWHLINGPIPDGKVIRHKCDNPICYNIEHLDIGTHKDNSQDMVSRGRCVTPHMGKTHCKRGHEFTKENTFLYRGSRTCKKCDNIRGSEYNKRKKAVKQGAIK